VFKKKRNRYFRRTPAERGKSFQVTEIRCGIRQSYGEECTRRDKKRGADDCRYSSLQAPQGPLHENMTMSTPLLLRALPFFGPVFEFCGFVKKTKKALYYFVPLFNDTKIIIRFKIYYGLIAYF